MLRVSARCCPLARPARKNLATGRAASRAFTNTPRPLTAAEVPEVTDAAGAAAAPPTPIPAPCTHYVRSDVRFSTDAYLASGGCGGGGGVLPEVRGASAMYSNTRTTWLTPRERAAAAEAASASWRVT